MKDLKSLKLLVIDVDGTMTDAGIYYDEHGNELKKFCTKDAAGFFAARATGIQTMVLTGRKCKAVERRMRELRVDYLYQNVKNKRDFLKTFLMEKQMSREQVGYIGDDLNDLPAMELAGYIACPKDACEEILAAADYVSSKEGGHGAVRDVIEHILTQCETWKKAVGMIYYNDYGEVMDRLSQENEK